MFQEFAHPSRLRFSGMFDAVTNLRVLLNQGLKLGLGILKTDTGAEPMVASYSFPPLIYLSGNAETMEALALVRSLPAMHIIVPSNDLWVNLLREELGDKLRDQKRWKLDHSKLDIDHVHKLVAGLNSSFILKKIDEVNINKCEKSFLQIMYTFHGSIEAYLEKYTGFCILHDNRVVSMAYPGHPFEEEFEIHIETLDSPEYRRKGLATVVGARIVEYALENGLVPHWDAANEPSVYLAQKLGYSNPRSYNVYYILQ